MLTGSNEVHTLVPSLNRPRPDHRALLMMMMCPSDEDVERRGYLIWYLKLTVKSSAAFPLQSDDRAGSCTFPPLRCMICTPRDERGTG